MYPSNYSLTLVTGPADTPVTLAFAKKARRIQSTSEDEVLEQYLAAAVEQVEMDADLKLMPQTWLMQFDRIECLEIWLPITPVLSVSGIQYRDPSTEELTTLDPSGYNLEKRGLPARLSPATGSTWPTAANRPGAWEVTILAGFVNAAAVPLRAKQASVMLFGHFEQNRELVSERNTKAVAVSYDRLVQGLRRGFA